MANIFAWILAAVWPFAKKVLVSLGIGIITYEGLSLLAGQVQGQVSALWGQVGGDVLSMAVLLGIPQSMGIVLGGISARISYVVAGKLGRIAS